MRILVAVLGLLIVVAVGVGLIMISLVLTRQVFGFVLVWWGKLLSFFTILMIVYGLVLVVGRYLLDAELPLD